VRSPAAKVDFPTGVSTTDVTGSGAIQGATVTGTTSVNTPSVDITTTAITAPGGVTTPQVSVSGSPAPKIAFPTGVSTPAVTAPGGVTTPQVVRSPAAKVDFPTGVSTTDVTGSGAIQGATVTGTTSVSTPSVTIATTSVTAPGGVTTPQVSRSGSPAPKVDFPTGVSTPSLTAPSIDGPGAQIHTQSLNNGPAANVNVILDASDRRLKRNLSGIKDSLDKVLRLKGLYFNWIEDDVSGIRTGDKSRRHLGLIAQDVKEVIPEAVSEIGKDNKYLGVNYNALIGLLVEAMKEMHLRVDQLEQETRALREVSRGA